MKYAAIGALGGFLIGALATLIMGAFSFVIPIGVGAGVILGKYAQDKIEKEKKK